MRKIYLFTFIVFALFIIQSCDKNETSEIIKSEIIKNPVDEKLAETIALKHITESDTRKSSKKIRSNTPYQENGETYMHVISFEDGGFTIVSGSELNYPVLAQSQTSQFEMDNLPYGLQLWLKTTAEDIRLLEKDALKVPKETKNNIKKQWSQYRTKYRIDGPGDDGGYCPSYTTTVGPLLNSVWGQRYGFNSLCPLVNSTERAPAGCVTIAMAQIMYYHQHPSLYNWGGMEDGEVAGDAPILIRDIFDQVIVSYDAERATGRTSRAANSFNDIFDYNAEKRNYNKNSDFNLIKSQIDARRPVYLRGNHQSTLIEWMGHAWVCDGYQITTSCGHTNNKLHMNWGWYGTGNGFFTYNNWEVDGPDGLRDYQYFNDIILDIYPK